MSLRASSASTDVSYPSLLPSGQKEKVKKLLIKLSCTLEGCKKRDEIVFKLCNQYQIPVQVSMGGGYSPEIKTIIEAHANTYRVAKSIF